MQIKSKITRILKFAIGDINYGIIVSKIKNRKYFQKHYSGSVARAANAEPIFIYIADGRVNHGGLADRLRGLVSLFDYCQMKGLQFKANFNDYFVLKSYLIEN
ncbi:hypothetical protein [Dysgonomonas alginatilytica]|nr:hypothetical protein [Dysgonomonas alginatilytica]